MLRRGFVAISDDDFSRVVIAERFAGHPAWDPSHTSWLPLPFWVWGAAFEALGASLSVARGVAIALGVLAALVVHRAAKLAGASRTGALVGAIVATGFPTAARLGVAFQPEAVCAALVVFGALTLTPHGATRLAGGAALGAACLCRYEAWPAAAVFALFCLSDIRPSSWSKPSTVPSDPHLDSPAGGPGVAGTAPDTLLAAALIAVASPIWWVLHGLTAHGDALFFLHRVAAYRRALGVTEPWLTSLAAYPVAFVRAEPELVLGAGVALVFLPYSRARRALLRPAVVLAAVLVFLIVGRLADGAPTHHGERTLLPLWTALALFASERFVQSAARAASSPARDAPAHRRMLPILAGALVVSLGIRIASPSESFQGRADERAIGAAARRVVPADARLVVDTADYGYFAVIAAFGDPDRAEPFDTHDPRLVRSRDAFASSKELGDALRIRGASWFVARAEHEPVANLLGRVEARAPGFVLIHATDDVGARPRDASASSSLR